MLQREVAQTAIWVGHLNSLLHAGKLFQQYGVDSNKINKWCVNTTQTVNNINSYMFQVH